MLRSNVGFLLLVNAHALNSGCFMTIGNLLSNLLDPFGFSPRDIAILGGELIVVGVASALTIGFILDRTAKYRLIHLTLLTCTTALAYLAIYALYVQKKWF